MGLEIECYRLAKDKESDKMKSRIVCVNEENNLLEERRFSWEIDMQLPYSDILDIAHFSRLFDNKSECYKLFWFQAIARKIKEGNTI